MENQRLRKSEENRKIEEFWRIGELEIRVGKLKNQRIRKIENWKIKELENQRIRKLEIRITELENIRDYFIL